MSRPLDLTQRQVRALCEGAKQAGCVPMVKIGNTQVWLVPEDHAVFDGVEFVDKEEDIRL